jgi:hypothetical protein
MPANMESLNPRTRTIAADLDHHPAGGDLVAGHSPQLPPVAQLLVGFA